MRALLLTIEACSILSCHWTTSTSRRNEASIETQFFFGLIPYPFSALIVFNLFYFSVIRSFFIVGTIREVEMGERWLAVTGGEIVV